MEKISRETPDLTQENIRRLAELFPDVVTESKTEGGGTALSVDFDALRGDLSDHVVDGERERYQFTWPGKREAKLEARRPTRKTMRPCPEKSVDWDTTQNLYIEGDNLEALKIMRETYAGKVKLIYIDPPYNTGHDFVYDDDYSQTRAEYDAESGDYDEEGGRLVANPESNGRFHSDWCSMMYPRLMLARDMLSDDGAIFISIDDNEVDNLKKLLDEVFGQENFAARFMWAKTMTPPALAYKCRKTVEYVLCYERAANKSKFFGDWLDNGDAPLLNSGNPLKQLKFPAGSIRFTFIDNGVVKAGRYEGAEVLSDIEILDGKNRCNATLEGRFKWQQDTLNDEVSRGTYFLAKTPKLSVRFQRPNDGTKYKTPTNYLPIKLDISNGVGTNETASSDMADLGMDACFDFTKPVSLIEYLIRMRCFIEKDDVILDFFSGSATTAHAVMRLNAGDGGNRKFIMVQLPEDCAEGSSAQKSGYSTICDLGEERIRRAGAKIKVEVEEANRQLELGVEPKPVPDIGFRVLRVDDSCLKDEYATPAEYDQTQLDLFADNAVEGAKPLDLLFQALPAFRIPYSAKIAERELGGKVCFDVNDGQLIACFDEDVDTAALEAIACERPIYALFRDASFSNDAAVANLEELFKTFSADTIRKVI